MSIPRFFLALAFFVSPFFALAQTDDAAKEKQRRETAFVEQILVDAKNLRLPENRAFVYAKIGGVLWQADEKRARRLFQDSISELTAAQNEAENERGNKQYLNNLIYGQSPRQEILNAIAVRDAEFALDAMIKTRPAKLAQALANFSGDNQLTSQQYARSEIQNEQRLVTLAADQNPQRAVKLLRESLKRGVSYETINLLKKIHEKDPETANALCAEAAQKLLETNLDENNNYQDSGMILNFLSEFGREKTAETASLAVSDQLLRSLAEKIVKTALRPNPNFYFSNPPALKIIERFFPTAAAQIKEKQSRFENQSGQNQNYAKLMQSDASAEELLSQARKFPVSSRGEIYRKAAEKTAQSGNVAEAQNILTANLPEEYADRYLSQMNWNLANQAVSQGKFDEANAFINSIPDENQRFSALIQLASAVYGKNPQENKSQAVAVLNQARILIADEPEKSSDMNALANLAAGFAQIEPAEAFRLLESLVSPLNELSEASAVMAKFNDYGSFRRGEFQLNGGGGLPGVYNFVNTIKTLKSKDFDRAVQVTNGFSRLDVRVSLQLQLIDENLPTNGGVIRINRGGRHSSGFIIDGRSNF